MTSGSKLPRAAVRGCMRYPAANKFAVANDRCCRLLPNTLRHAKAYTSLGQLTRHMDRLQSLANTVEPAKPRHQFGRRSKIVCTIGPKVANEADIAMLMGAGMNVARFNFSHGEYEWFEKVIAMIRKVKEERGRPDVAIALDTKGPEIRTGQLKEGSPMGNPGFVLPVAQGDSMIFSCDEALASAGGREAVYIDYSDIGNTLEPGDLMMVDDGLLEFVVEESGDGWIRALASNSGALGERKGVNLPGATLTLPAVSEKDQQDLKFGVEQEVDLIFASFVRKGSHIDQIRAVLGEHGQRLSVIAKIENLEGVQNFDEILSKADGIMVARGDLGIEIPAPKVFVAQKLVIQKANFAGKPVICATQMLESMVANPRPTRAEVSDVANAVMDGADAVMLSGETAKGAWPEAAVETMAAVVREAEAVIDTEQLEVIRRTIMPRHASSIEAVVAAAVQACQDQDANMLLLVTETGEAPRLAAKYRPGVPIVACCPTEETARRCALLRGVVAIVVPWQTQSDFASVSVSSVISAAIHKVTTEMGVAKEGEKAVVLHDTNINDDFEFEDWVMRMVDLSTGIKTAND